MEHPGLIDTTSIEILDGRTSSTPLHEVYGYDPSWGPPSRKDREHLVRMTDRIPQGRSAPASRA